MARKRKDKPQPDLVTQGICQLRGLRASYRIITRAEYLASLAAEQKQGAGK